MIGPVTLLGSTANRRTAFTVPPLAGALNMMGYAQASVGHGDGAMRRGPAFWMVFLILGSLLWLTSIGVWSHPAYRLVLMLAVFSWFGYVVRIPKSH